MPRYRNVGTGVVVNVPEEKFANLVGYENADESKPAAKSEPAKPAAKPASK